MGSRVDQKPLASEDDASSNAQYFLQPPPLPPISYIILCSITKCSCKFAIGYFHGALSIFILIQF